MLWNEISEQRGTELVLQSISSPEGRRKRKKNEKWREKGKGNAEGKR